MKIRSSSTPWGRKLTLVMLGAILVLAAAAVVAVAPGDALAAKKEKPGKVQDVTLEQEYGRAIMVTWQPPATGGKPKIYLVKVRDVNGGPIFRSANYPLEDSPIQWAWFGCLDQGETYKVRVRAENKAGRGPVKVGRIYMEETPISRPDGLMPCPQDR